MNTIPHIQAQPDWSTVTGESINGTPDGGIPKLTLSAQPSPLLIAIDGVPGKYADGVARSADIPIPPNTGHALLTVTFSLDEASLEFAQALEMGAKFTLPSGLTLNGQLQFDYSRSATEMTLDLTSVNGYAWAPSPVSLPKFAPNQPHTVAIAYALWDKDIAVPSVSVDGKVYNMPAEMQGVPGKQLGWGKNAFMVNIQPDTNPKGGAWNWTLLDVAMAWT